jgi:hypothetical protein
MFYQRLMNLLQKITLAAFALTLSLSATAQESTPVDVSAPIGLAIIAALIIFLKPRNKK